jgi:hypothetical protein
MVMKVLFILKYRENVTTDDDYSLGYSSSLLSSGLLNSARFVSDNLNDCGITSEIVQAVDNNCIDGLVTKHKPDVVIIEAYWVVPEKFEILSKIHPRVKWVIRNHSAMPFIGNEGQIIDWSLRYMDYPAVYVSCNDPRTNQEFRNLVANYKPDWSKDNVDAKIILLPNFYPTEGANNVKAYKKSKPTLDVACFGAIRPLKNQLIQAVAAIEYATKIGKTLNFHINGGRVEGAGAPVLCNLRKLFELQPVHNLVEHTWLPHDEFLALLSTMDLSMQVSYSETFNIVTADAVKQGIPVVVSSDINWVDAGYVADPNSSKDIIGAMKRALLESQFAWLIGNLSLHGLQKHSQKSTKDWLEALENLMTLSC